MAEGATVANAFVQIMPSMEGATSNITDALMPGIESSGGKAGSKFGNVFSGKMGTVLKGAGALAIAGFAASAVTDSFTTIEAGFNNIKLATGATGEAAEQLKEVYLDVSTSVVGSFEDIGSAVGELNTRLGLEGKDLEDASEAMMKYAKVTGQDATEATKDVASMMRNVGIPTSELSDTLGKLTVAGQAAGVDVSSLADNITKYNAVMKQLGLTTDEQIALMAQFEVSGADTSSILNAMKKGVASWAKEGKDARVEFENFVKGVQDGTITAGDAVDIFGSKGGLSMYEAAQKGQLSFEGMFDAISNASYENLDSIYQETLTAQEKFDLLGKTAQAGIYEILEPIVDALLPYMDDIIELAKEIIQFAVKSAMPTIKALAPIIGQIANIIVQAIHGIEQAFDSLEPVIQTVSGIFQSAGDAMSHPMETADSIIQNALGNIQRIFDSLNLSLPKFALPHFDISGGKFPWGIGGDGYPPSFSVEWYGKGGFADDATVSFNGYGERGAELYWPSYEPYFDQYAKGIAEHMPSQGVDIHDCTFVIRQESDIRKVAQELNTLINRQTAGAYA